ncbi:PREDICTED: protein NUCLEAR FUSION DEFECTIVE 4-like [Camelina sativa]|uniref:Protein NUCLEAR FUSION DEFECTIVE 4-like n=1 Tax=Camelina sativa TaxID=90675 RepID=A0ABM0Z4N8_CAMSA|nr:PREDICTED: protein NUCLEAR FUSION DEFECTIVE 4-like [Camelina sativa]
MSPKVLPWLSLVAVLWLQSFNGTNLSFPAYSSQLKEFLSISQFKLNYLSFASDAGKVLGFISGIAAVYLPLPLVLLVGGSLGFAGYGLQYLSIVKNMFTLSFPQIWCLSFLAGNSICWINTACYIVAINSFPMNRQVAVGITASFQGLSGKIYTDMVNSFSNSSPREAASGYLLLNSLVPLVACFVTAPMLMRHGGDKTTSSTKDVKVGFIVLFVLTIATGIYAVATSLLSAPTVLVLVGITLFLFSPIGIPIGVWFKEFVSSRKTQQKVHDLEAPDKFELVEEEDHTKEEEEFEKAIVGVKEEVEWTQLWKKQDFWIYFGLYLFGPTVGLVFMNNLGQIAESRGCTATSSLVALASSFGFFGRLLPSLLDYFFSRSKYMPSSPVSMAVSLVAMVASFLLLLVDSDISLFISTAVIGVFSGALTSLSVTMTAELFGTKHFGVNHNIVVGNIPIGSLAFGTLAAKVYRDGAALYGDDGKCFGMHCFQITLVYWGMLCSIAAVLATVLYLRNRKFYSQKP